MPWLAEEMLDVQRQRVDAPAYARIAYDGLPHKKTGREYLLNDCSCSPDNPFGQGTELLLIICRVFLLLMLLMFNWVFLYVCAGFPVFLQEICGHECIQR